MTSRHEYPGSGVTAAHDHNGHPCWSPSRPPRTLATFAGFAAGPTAILALAPLVRDRRVAFAYLVAWMLLALGGLLMVRRKSA